MPVPGKDFDASALFASNPACESEEQYGADHDETNSHVKGVQADERVVRRAKKICGDGESVFVDQAVPFLAGAVKKEAAEKEC